MSPVLKYGSDGTPLTRSVLPPAALSWAGSNYMYSGATVSIGTGLSVNIGAATNAIFNGYNLNQAAGSLGSLTASTTNYIWAVVNGTLDGLTYSKTTVLTPPVSGGSILIGSAVTGVSTVTSVTTAYRGIVMPGLELGYTTYGSDTTSGVLTELGNFTVVGNGINTMTVQGFASQVDRSTDFQFYYITDALNAAGTRYSTGIVRTLSATLAMSGRIPAFSGTKTIYFAAAAPSAGNYTIYGASHQVWVKGTWT